MKKNALYYSINIAFAVIAICFINFTGVLNSRFDIFQLFHLLILFGLIHFIKFIKIYFIIMEEKVPFTRMIKTYIKTTFVSSLLPFKIGETFKMYSYGVEIGDYSKGIISVLIDKFFDAVILCLLLIPIGLYNKNISSLALILLIFLIILFFVYKSFIGTYKYLNRYFVTKVSTKSSIYVLNILDKLKQIHKKATQMLEGRQIVILFLSLFAWLAEALLIYRMAIYLNMKHNLTLVLNYINDSFFGIENILFNNYIYLGTVVFLLILIVIYAVKYIKIFLKLLKR